MSETSRREFLKGSALATAGMATGNLRNDGLLKTVEAAVEPASAQQSSQGVALKWLADQPPLVSTGVSWGVPWPKGSVRRETAFRSKQSRDRSAAAELASCRLARWFHQVDGLCHGSASGSEGSNAIGARLQRYRCGRADRDEGCSCGHGRYGCS